VRVLGEQGTPLWADTARLERRAAGADTSARTQVYSGVVSVPVARLGIGIITVVLRRPDTGDSTRTRLFVSLGEDLPITNFDEMVSYLRYFAAPDRLRALREGDAAARGAAWAAFLRESDPDPATTQHEGLRGYFARIRQANVRFNEDGTPGWITDRGMALVGVGEPDNIIDQGIGDIGVRGRTQVWEYRDQRLQLVFVDQTGYGRYRLTPSSASELQGAIRRRQLR
jgi:GWxTD domain-containing protein